MVRRHRDTRIIELVFIIIFFVCLCVSFVKIEFDWYCSCVVCCLNFRCRRFLANDITSMIELDFCFFHNETETYRATHICTEMTMSAIKVSMLPYVSRTMAHMRLVCAIWSIRLRCKVPKFSAQRSVQWNSRIAPQLINDHQYIEWERSIGMACFTLPLFVRGLYSFSWFSFWFDSIHIILFFPAFFHFDFRLCCGVYSPGMQYLCIRILQFPWQRNEGKKI